MRLGCEDFEPIPIVDEDELTDWLSMEVDTGGFMASVTIDEWYNGNPKTITINLEYKTGDGCDQPYNDYPPDEAIIKNLEKHGWTVETEGTMIYPHLMVCPKCGEVNSEECEEAKDVPKEAPSFFKHKKCGSWITDYVRGSKWIRGYKTIKLKGNETAEEIKKKIEEAILDVLS